MGMNINDIDLGEYFLSIMNLPDTSDPLNQLLSILVKNKQSKDALYLRVNLDTKMYSLWTGNIRDIGLSVPNEPFIPFGQK